VEIRRQVYIQVKQSLEAYMVDPGTARVVLFSFGFKYGTPVDVNVMLDVRFLPNPYWQDELRPKTGLDPEVAHYVLGSDAGKALFDHLPPLLRYMVAQHTETGREVIRIGIGCTGGRHRSVAVTEKIGVLLKDNNVEVTLFHRDIHKDSPAAK
jgi:UPF0042 nucleotide-binding protein